MNGIMLSVLLMSQWSPSVQIGEINEMVHEASGLETSRLYPGRLYHINDSGDKARVYVTDDKGQKARSISIQDFNPKDTEDLSLGACPIGKSSCLYVADIGDNRKARSSVQIAIIDEINIEGKSVRPMNILTLTYPEGAQNAESMAIHPSGDIFIITKAKGRSRLYKVAKSELMKRQTKAELMGTLELQDDDQLATSMDISEDGKSFLMMTYEDVFEFHVDLANVQKGYNFGREIQGARAQALEKQEAVAYFGNEGFIYTSEGHSPLMLVRRSK